MKKHYLLIFSIFFFVQHLSAQITLTTSNNYSVGDMYTYNFIDGTGFNPGPSGTLVNWNFGSVTSTAMVTSELVDPSTLTNGALFTSANIGIQDPTTMNESYYYTSNDAQGFVGAIGNQGPVQSIIIYDDPQDWIRYPMEFGDSFTDTFSGTVQTTTTLERGGTAFVVVDGWGSLTTPSGTFNNVVRVFTNMVYGDTLMGAPLVSYDEIRYLWYDVESGFPLMSYSNLMTAGVGLETASYADLLETGINTPLATDIELSVFPNPTADFINIDYELNEKAKVEISVCNLVGKEVIQVANETQSQGNQSYNVDLSNLPNGSYFVKLIIGNDITTQKVSVQK